MQTYNTDTPAFSDSIEILETTDTNHADNFNVATKKLFENTKVLKQQVADVAESSHELVDDTTSQKYKMGVDNGMIYVEAVETATE